MKTIKSKFKTLAFLLSLFLVFSTLGATVHAQELPNKIFVPVNKGEGVRQVQVALNKLGYNLATDGSYGPATTSAVVDFQKRYSSLSNDGSYGPNTRAVMLEALDSNSSNGSGDGSNNGNGTPLPSTSLQYLEQGSDVRKVQVALNKLGYNLATDGSYGPATRSAVRDFQKNYSNLINNGIYGSNTRAAMIEALDGNSGNGGSNGNSETLPNTGLSYLEQSSDVRKVQEALNRLGYNLATDGSYGPATRSAVRDFQKNYSNLINNGIYGSNTRAAMIEALDGNSGNDGQTSGKIAYLTFDDGPSRNITPRILNTLNDYNIEATFFVLGNMAEKNPSILKRIQNEEHSIGNHTYSHDYDYVYASINNFLGEVSRTDNILKNILGSSFNTSLIRFPGGSFESYKDPFKSAVRNKGYKIYDWNASNGDSRGTNLPVSTLMSNLKQSVSGERELVVLMHDSYYKNTTAQALPRVIEYLRNQGYSFRSLAE